MIRDNMEIICYNSYINAAVWAGGYCRRHDCFGYFPEQADNGKERKKQNEKESDVIGAGAGVGIPGI